MSVTYQDVLEAVCSEVSLVNANDTQHIFAITDAREAKLAYDILAAHGFDVRVYSEADASKLYIIHPAAGGGDNENLSSALHYAHTLKQLLDAMPETDFTVAFANTSTQGKQISIYFPPAKAGTAPPVATTSSPAAAARRPPVATPLSRPKAPRRAKEPNILNTGPELGKKYPFGIPSSNGNPNKMTLSKWLSTYVFSNFAESFYAFLGMTFFILVLFSLWTVTKGYLCPDLATVKNRAWYCVERGR